MLRDPTTGDASVPAQPYTAPAPTRIGTMLRDSTQGDASVPTQPYTAPTRIGTMLRAWRD
jgi:hypothetical protein